MQWNKVKSILIAILVVVDGFLMLNLVSGFYADYKREAEKNQNFITVLGQKGIQTGDTFLLPEAKSLPMLEVDRSKNDEDSFTKGLLGNQMERKEDIDGSTTYESDIGSVKWSSEGKILGAFYLEGYTNPSSEHEIRLQAAKLLEHCGISSSARIQIDVETKSAIIAFDTAGAPVFNRYLRFGFEQENIAISGWWTFQTPYMVQTNNYVLCESTDSILALLKEEQEIRTIESAEIGYVLLTGNGRQTSIVPCCRILTDVGEFFVDSLKNILIYP